MNIDKFGRSARSTIKNQNIIRGPPGIGFKRTSNGNYDLENHKLCNVETPTELGDCVNLQFLLLKTKMVKDDVTAFMEDAIRLIKVNIQDTAEEIYTKWNKKYSNEINALKVKIKEFDKRITDRDQSYTDMFSNINKNIDNMPKNVKDKIERDFSNGIESINKSIELVFDVKFTKVEANIKMLEKKWEGLLSQNTEAINLLTQRINKLEGSTTNTTPSRRITPREVLLPKRSKLI